MPIKGETRFCTDNGLYGLKHTAKPATTWEIQAVLLMNEENLKETFWGLSDRDLTPYFCKQTKRIDLYL